LGWIFFSVGDTVGDDAGEVVAVVVADVGVFVVLPGPLLLPPPQAAVNAPSERIAAAPAMAGRRRTERPDLMMQSYLCAASSRYATHVEMNRIVQKHRQSTGPAARSTWRHALVASDELLDDARRFIQELGR